MVNRYKLKTRAWNTNLMSELLVNYSRGVVLVAAVTFVQLQKRKTGFNHQDVVGSMIVRVTRNICYVAEAAQFEGKTLIQKHFFILKYHTGLGENRNIYQKLCLI